MSEAPILTLDAVSKRFDPRLTLGDRIAAAIGPIDRERAPVLFT